MQQSNEHELDISDLSAFLARKAGIDLYGVGDVSVGLADELQHISTVNLDLLMSVKIAPLFGMNVLLS